MDILVGLLIVAAMLYVLSRPFRKGSAEEEQIYRRVAGLGNDGEQRVPCPYCAEPILPKAQVCRHCGRDLPPPAPEG